MADFRAKIIADADLKNATSAIESFIKQARKLKVDVDLNLTNAGQNLTGILSQLQNQARSSGTSAGSQWASGFNSSLGRINVSATTEQINDLKGSLSNGFQFDSKSVNNITKEIGNMGVEVERVQTKLNSKGGMNVSVKGTDQLQRAVTVTKTYNDKSEEVASTLNIVATAEKKATQQATARANVTDKVAKAEKMASKAQLEIAGNNLTAWASKNTKATAAFGERIRTLQEEMKGMQDSGATAQQFKEWSDNVKVLKSEANATGNIGKTFADSFGSAFSSMVKFAASYVSIRKVFSEMENGIKTVVALDDALVDLQKTTTATPQQLNNFYSEANNIAKQYGTTTQQIIQGAADWSRLGYSLEDSKTMAKLSSQFAAISPGMDVETSTNSLVSTMKANLCLVS